MSKQKGFANFMVQLYYEKPFNLSLYFPGCIALPCAVSLPAANTNVPTDQNQGAMMFTDIVGYKHWVFEVPSKLTRKIYSNTLCGYSEFHVQEFRSYFKYHDEIFSQEIKDLLHRLGIDYKKDTFLKVIEDKTGKQSFAITYQFLGSMEVKAPERMQEPYILNELEYEPISDSTSIAFYQVEETMIGKEIIYVELLFVIPDTPGSKV